MQLKKTFRFEASHVLPKHNGKCSSLHGHSWILHVYVEGKVDKSTGFVKDYTEISSVVKPLIEELDHVHLGAWETEKYSITWFKLHSQPARFVSWLDSKNFNPTSENLIIEIGKQLVKVLDWSALEIEETCTSACLLTREEFSIITQE